MGSSVQRHGRWLLFEFDRERHEQLNAAPPARPSFQPGLPGWLSFDFDNKYTGGGVLEAAVQAILQVRPLPPILEIFKYGAVGRFDRL